MNKTTRERLEVVVKELASASDSIYPCTGLSEVDDGNEYIKRAMSHLRAILAETPVETTAKTPVETCVEHTLGNLLAVIFGDGGHKQATFASIEDAGRAAEAVVVSLVARAEAAEQNHNAYPAMVKRLRQLEEENKQLWAHRRLPGGRMEADHAEAD